MRARELGWMFLFPLTVLAVSLLFLALDLYSILPQADIPLHITGGLALGMSYVTLFHAMQKEGYVGEMRGLLVFVFIVSLVALTSVLWEFSEFVVDQLTALSMQPSIADTMMDLFLGVVGGSAGTISLFLSENRKKNDL